MNLIGIIVSGEKTSAVAGRKVHLRGGAPCDAEGNLLDISAEPKAARSDRKRVETPAPIKSSVPSARSEGLFA